MKVIHINIDKLCKGKKIKINIAICNKKMCTINKFNAKVIDCLHGHLSTGPEIPSKILQPSIYVHPERDNNTPLQICHPCEYFHIFASQLGKVKINIQGILETAQFHLHILVVPLVFSSFYCSKFYPVKI